MRKIEEKVLFKFFLLKKYNDLKVKDVKLCALSQENKIHKNMVENWPTIAPFTTIRCIPYAGSSIILLKVVARLRN